MNRLVELEHISKAYANKSILHDVSFTIFKNQVTAILGGNGAGKSTILRIVAGLERPSSGKITYFSKGLKIGYIPERFPKHLRFTPGEYLSYVGKVSGIPDAELKKTIAHFLQRFQLDKWNRQRIMNLSKGNIQKVGIIQAILQTPELLILDEPVSGLDLHAQKELLAVIKELKEQGTSILLTYHDSTVFKPIIETAYYLDKGFIAKADLTKREPIKLLEVKQIDESRVKQWDEVLYTERKADRLLLYVHVEHSDRILFRVLQLKGSIDRVITIDHTEKFNNKYI